MVEINFFLKTKFATTWLSMGIQSHVRGVSDEIWSWSFVLAVGMEIHNSRKTG